MSNSQETKMACFMSKQGEFGVDVSEEIEILARGVGDKQ